MRNEYIAVGVGALLVMEADRQRGLTKGLLIGFGYLLLLTAIWEIWS